MQKPCAKRVRSAAIVAGLALTTVVAGGAASAPQLAFAASATPKAAAGSTRTARATAAAAKEYQVTDSSYDLDDQIASSLGDATVIKVNTSWVATGTATIPAQVTQIIGWQEDFFTNPGVEKVREIGNIRQTTHTLTFAAGSTTEVRSISFKLNNDKLTIPAGANITFKNCTFSNEIVIEKGGRATFENCTFTGKTIKNNGKATYTGSTVEPTNKGAGGVRLPKARPLGARGQAGRRHAQPRLQPRRGARSHRHQQGRCHGDGHGLPGGLRHHGRGGRR